MRLATPPAADVLGTALLHAVVKGGTSTDEACLREIKAARCSCKNEHVWRFVLQNMRVPRNAWGTLAHFAASLGLWKTYCYLVDSGANPYETDEVGRLPSEVAALQGHVSVGAHIRCLYEPICAAARLELA